MRRIHVFLAAIVILISAQTVRAQSTAQVINDINEVMIRIEPLSRFTENMRIGAMVHLAVHDAVNSIPGVKRYHTYLGEVAGDWTGASPEAAAIEAGYRTMLLYIDELRLTYPQPYTAPTAQRFSAPISDADYNRRRSYLDNWHTGALAAIPDGTAKSQGILLGQLAGQRMFDSRVGDGWDVVPTATYPHPLFDPAGVYTGLFGPYNPYGTFPLGQYTIHYPSFFGFFIPVASRWWWARDDFEPFALDDIDEFLAAPPPAPTNAQFLADLEETRTYGEKNSAVRTTEQTLIVQWWQGCAGTGYGLPNKAAQAVVLHHDADLVDAARAFALITVAMMDAVIVNIHSKTTHNFWRPITAINRLYPPPTAAQSWMPYLATPPNQEYPAGHPMISGGAGAGILGYLYGFGEVPGGYTITGFPVDDPLRPQAETGQQCDWWTPPNVAVKTYASLNEMAHEVVSARVWGGIHFRDSGKEGVKNGKRIAHWIHARLLLPL